MLKRHTIFRFIVGLVLAVTVVLPAQALSLTDYGENKLIDVLFRNTAFSEAAPANYYIGLFTAACSDTGGGTEVTGGSYARVAIARSLAGWTGTHGTTTGTSSGTGGTAGNAAAVTFPAATADWGTVTHWGIFDASTSGNLIACAALTTSRNITTGATPAFGAGALTFQIDN